MAAAATLALLVVPVLEGPRLWRQAKAWRAREFTSQAEAAIARNDPRKASEALAAATRLAPFEPAVLRARARYALLDRNSNAAELWLRLVQMNPGSAQDWEGLLLASLQRGDRVQAYRALEGFRKAAPQETAAFRRYQCRVLVAWDKGPAAADLASDILRTNQSNPVFDLYARELMLRGNETQRAEALAWLDKKGEDPGQDGLAALILMARATGRKNEASEALSVRLRSHPLAGWEARLLAQVLHISAGKKDEAAGWRELGSSLSVEERIQAARWLVAGGRAVAATGWISPEEARKNRGAYHLYLDILGARGQWAEMAAFLTEAPPFLPTCLHYAYRSRAAEKQGDEGLGLRYWRLALVEANKEPTNKTLLANYAAAMGWDARAEELCRELAADPGMEVQGLMGLVSLARKRGDRKAEAEWLTQLNKAAPHLAPAARR
ncbi:MAG: hypothetical protein SFU85_06835 [Candidatus Methylacidiphilales bacterium]|nr:hypothetical protein [Candidatus Methylacidiphilales bacterium]